MTVVVGTKPLPTIDTVADGDAVAKPTGVNETMAGAGLSTSRLTVAPLALVAEPFRTTTGINAPEVSCAAGTIAVSCVVPTYVVASATVPTCTVDPLVKFVPFTVSVTALAPAASVAGVTEATVGLTTVGVVGVVVVVVDDDPPPPLEQPASDKPSSERRKTGANDAI